MYLNGSTTSSADDFSSTGILTYWRKQAREDLLVSRMVARERAERDLLKCGSQFGGEII